MALVTLNTVIARDSVDLLILKKKTDIVNRVTGVQHLEAVQDNGDGTFTYSVSALEDEVNTMDYLLGMIEAVAIIEDIEQQAMEMAQMFAASTTVQ